MKQIILTLFIVAVFLSTKVQGQSVAWKIANLEKYMHTADSILVINFWATFCKPCIRELPYMQSISEKFKDKKVALLLVSLDLPEAYPGTIDSFAKANNYTASIVWLNETNADYFCPKVDKGWGGAIPTTLFINRKKGYRKLVQDQMDKDGFESELRKAL